MSVSVSVFWIRSRFVSAVWDRFWLVVWVSHVDDAYGRCGCCQCCWFTVVVSLLLLVGWRWCFAIGVVAVVDAVVVVVVW